MIFSGQRIMWFLTLGIFLATTTGCGTTHTRTVEEELAREGTGLNKESGQRIRGYILQDDIKTEYRGRAKLAGQDSLSFWKVEKADRYQDQSNRDKTIVPGPTYPLAAIKALLIGETSTGKTLLVTVGVVAALVFVAVGIAALAAAGDLFGSL